MPIQWEAAPKTTIKWDDEPIQADAAGGISAGDVTREFLGQGVAFGSGDEIEAGVRSLVGDETYSEELEKIRGEMGQFREDHPYVAGGAELAGGLATAFLPGVAVARGAGMGARIGAGAATGAGYGALYGAGTGTDAQSRISGAGIGAGVGALAGGAAVPLVAGVQAAARGGKNLYDRAAGTVRGVMDVEGESARRVAGAVDADRALGQGLDEADFLAAQSRGQPVNLMETGGETVRAMGRSAANTTPEGRAVLESSLMDRSAGQNTRTGEFIRRIVGGTDATTTREKLVQASRKANRPAYKKAYKDGSAGVWSPELERLTGSEAVVDAMRKASKEGKDWAIVEGYGAFNPKVNITESGVSFNRGAKGSPDFPDLQYWDYVKRSLDDTINAARRSGNNNTAARVTGLKNQLVAELDKAVPSYKRARSGAAKAFDAEDALEAGQKFVTSNKPIAEARAALNKMSTADRVLFREGFASDLVDKVMRTGDGRSIAKSIFNSPQAREKISMALGPRNAKELEAFLHVETIMDWAKRAVTSNSTTARQLAEMGLAGGARLGASGALSGGGYAYATGDYSAIGMGSAAIVGAFVKNKIDVRVARKVADMLVSDNPEQVRRAVQRIAKSDKFIKALRVLDLPAATGASQTATDMANESMRKPLEIRLTPDDVAKGSSRQQ